MPCWPSLLLSAMFDAVPQEAVHFMYCRNEMQYILQQSMVAVAIAHMP